MRNQEFLTMSTNHSSTTANTKAISPADPDGIPAEQRSQWRADVAAMRDLHVAHEQSPLQMGDLYNELKVRWDVKMPALAKEAGVPYHAARQRAHIAELAGPGSKLRATRLSYSIIRLLAPLPDPEPWAQLALAQQSQGQLRVRAFAQLLVDAGLRRPRRTRSYSPPCLHCDAMWGDHHTGVHIRGETESGYLCSPRCAAAYFADIQARSERKTLLLSRFAGSTRESQSPSPAAATLTPESQSPPPAPNPESQIQTPKSEADAPPVRHESQLPASSRDVPAPDGSISHCATSLSPPIDTAVHPEATGDSSAAEACEPRQSSE
jgi:hypothetical protein